MKTNDFRQYLDKLEKKETFTPLLKQFIHYSIAEQYGEEDEQNEGKISYADFYEMFVRNVFLVKADYVFQFAQSPIEKMFLNSFLLLFLRNRMPCLYITPPFDDTEKDIDNIRNCFKRVDSFIESYKEITGDKDLVDFDEKILEKQKQNKLSEEEVEDILAYKNFRKEFEWNSYHITPQASFPNIKIENKSIRVDLYIWVPNDPSVKIVVECDGFQYHNNKTSFVNDKIRDRNLMLKGYKVIRYSGTEIYNDPVQIASNLFDLLEALDEDKEKLRVL